jgi:ribosome biogenesis GTPase
VVAVDDINMIDPIAVGDEVAFIDSGDGTGMITEILPRTRKLSRQAAGKKPLEQVIVSNADQVIPVLAAAKPKPKWKLLDRYLATAEAADHPAIVCITKMDLANCDTLIDDVSVYRRIGYPVILTSAVTGEGLDELENVLKDRTSVLLGKSGVGKTTLLNAIQPGLGLRINDVSNSTGKGKHTTSHLEMFELECGGRIIDTPGMREFGIWNADTMDIAGLFPEMRPYIGSCRFGLGCSHTHEPGCAIKEAVEAGDIAYHRYQSYLDIGGN